MVHKPRILFVFLNVVSRAQKAALLGISDPRSSLWESSEDWDEKMPTIRDGGWSRGARSWNQFWVLGSAQIWSQVRSCANVPIHLVLWLFTSLLGTEEGFLHGLGSFGVRSGVGVGFGSISGWDSRVLFTPTNYLLRVDPGLNLRIDSSLQSLNHWLRQNSSLVMKKRHQTLATRRWEEQMLSTSMTHNSASLTWLLGWLYLLWRKDLI